MCALPIKMRSHSSADKSIDYDFNRLKKMRRLLKKLKRKKFRVKKKLRKLKTKNLRCQKKVLTDILNFIRLTLIVDFWIVIKKMAFKFCNIKNTKKIILEFVKGLSAAYIVLDNYRHDVQKIINNHKYDIQEKSRKTDIKIRVEKRDKIAQRQRDKGDDSSYFRLDRG